MSQESRVKTYVIALIPDNHQAKVWNKEQISKEDEVAKLGGQVGVSEKQQHIRDAPACELAQSRRAFPQDAPAERRPLAIDGVPVDL